MGKVEPVRKARDPVELLLRRIAWRALHGSLLGGAAAAVGCSTGDAEQTLDDAVRAQSDASVAPLDGALSPRDARAASLDAAHELAPADSVNLCPSGGGFPVDAAALTTAQPFDFLSIRGSTLLDSSRDAGAGGDVWGMTPFTVLSQTGNACATATDATCAATLKLHPSGSDQEFCTQACGEWSVVTTRGNEVKRWDSAAELLALLAPIDTYADALMLATGHSYNVGCYDLDSEFIGRIPEGLTLRWVRAVTGGYELLATRYLNTCPELQRRFKLFVSTAGEVRELEGQDFQEGGCIGRIPQGLRTRSIACEESVLGEHLAHCAHLEAASVRAFVRLAEELHAHGAPAALITRALQAADDEVRHAAMIGQLARAHGATLTEPEVERLPTRSLEEIALENAVEGCVRETYGALVGAYQAERAGDTLLRHAMQSIAIDEARHAALSHDVDAWLRTKLSAPARARIRRAQQRAVHELLAASARPVEPALQGEAGLPPPSVAHAMLSELARELWQPELAA